MSHKQNYTYYTNVYLWFPIKTLRWPWKKQYFQQSQLSSHQQKLEFSTMLDKKYFSMLISFKLSEI